MATARPKFDRVRKEQKPRIDKDGSLKNAPTKKSAVSIGLTGRRRDDRFRVDFSGRPIWLPCVTLKSLIVLIQARIQSESGLTRISSLTIHRLRRALPARGKQLIQTGSGQEYRLAIPKSKSAPASV